LIGKAMKELYEKVIITSVEDLPSIGDLYHVYLKDGTKACYLLNDQGDFDEWIEDIACYLRPVSDNRDAIIKKQEELIKLYSSFTNWVNKHNTDIIESLRGKGFIFNISMLEEELTKLKSKI
jgi:ribosomal protein L11 methylase PrmA